MTALKRIWCWLWLAQAFAFLLVFLSLFLHFSWRSCDMLSRSREKTEEGEDGQKSETLSLQRGGDQA